MKIQIKSKNVGPYSGEWIKGTTDTGYLFWAKVFTEPSHYGIPTSRFPKGGTVSKLTIEDQDGTCLFEYDRGTAGSPSEKGENAMRHIVSFLENAYCLA